LSTPAQFPSLESNERSLYRVTEALEGFLDAWESDDIPPDLVSFLPQASSCRRLILVELIKVDLELRWTEHALPKRIGEYIDELPELAEGGVPADLIYEEFHIRKNCGFNVDPQEYLDQFPTQADELACLLGLEEPYHSTGLFQGASKRRLENIEPGQTIGDFELMASLGEGAFAKVFLARQTSMQRLVALKISADSGTEPQTLAQFDHDYIVRVFDQRLVADKRMRLLYMQYVPGGTLQSVLRTLRQTDPSDPEGNVLLRAVRQSLEDRGEFQPTESSLVSRLESYTWPETVCWLGACLARALDYAHRRGVLHRDVKPANVLLTAEGVPKLADFNISFSSKLTGATPAAYFGGSLAYMSPEQLEACNPNSPREPDSLDGRSDLYSLGVVLWELLTRTRPIFDEPVEGGWSKTLEAMIKRRKNGIDAEAFKRLPEGSPPGLKRVFAICLSADPDDRWRSGEEMAKQLELCRNRRVQDLLHPPANSWRARLGRHALLLVVLSAAIPNIFAGWCNWAYNRTEIIPGMIFEARNAFETLVWYINGIAYPAGLGALVGMTWSVVRGVRKMKEGNPLDADQMKRLRYRCLHLGHWSGMIGVALWGVAGLTYPISLDISGQDFDLTFYAHFFADLLICGLIAAAYPFFGATYFGLRVLYPGLLRDDLSASDDSPTLMRLSRLARYYLLAAILSPLLGLIAMAFLTLESNLPLTVLSIGGFLGVASLLPLRDLLQKDLAVLTEALGPKK